MCHGVPQRIAQELCSSYSGRKVLMTGMCFCALCSVPSGKQGHFPLTRLLHLNGIQPSQGSSQHVFFCRVGFCPAVGASGLNSLLQPCVIAVMAGGLTTSCVLLQGVFSYTASPQKKKMNNCKIIGDWDFFVALSCSQENKFDGIYGLSL